MIFLNYLILFVLIAVIYEFNFNISSLGGSVILIIPMSIITIMRFFMRPFVIEFKLIILLISGLFFTNFMSFWEMHNNNINTNFLNLSFIFLYCFIFCLIYVLLGSFKGYDDVSKKDQLLLRQVIALTLLPMIIFGLGFSMISGLLLYLSQHVEPRLKSLSIIEIGFFWILVSLSVSYYFLSKIKDADMISLIKDSKLCQIKCNPVFTRNISLWTLTTVIVGGTFLEIPRGLWIMWIETVSFIILMALFLFKIYRNTFTFNKEGEKRGTGYFFGGQKKKKKEE